MSLKLARKIAKRVEEELKNSAYTDWGEKLYLGADGEATHRIDDIAEKAALDAVKDDAVAFLSEEAGLVMPDINPKYICVLDPLDGSANAISKIPFYCTSVAVAPWTKNPGLEDVTAGVIINLVTGDIFEAEKDGGARLNGKVIKTSNTASPGEATASLYLKSSFDLIPLFKKVRAMGAVALELGLIASGTLDYLLDNRDHLKVSDVAAGKILIEEAGGIVSDLMGNKLNNSILTLGKVSLHAAGNPNLHSEVLRAAKKL